MPPKRLSKSRFKEGWDCPTTLSYSGKPEYANANADDAFLKALADGGFQVGALARLHYGDGIFIETLDNDVALAQTQELLQRDHVIIHEAAVAHGSLLCRIDILVKRGDTLQVIEVKAKSFNAREESFFKKPKKNDPRPTGLYDKWVPYVADVAFQSLVCQRAYPAYTITPYLMLLDKSTQTTVDGLHQRFLLQRDANDRAHVVLNHAASDNLGAPILTLQDVTREVAALDRAQTDGSTFATHVDKLAHAYVSNTRIPPVLGTHCRGCVYRIDTDAAEAGKKSGFETCWTEITGLSPETLRTRPLVIDGGTVGNLVGQGIYLLEDVQQSDVTIRPDDEPGLSRGDRQWLRVEKLQRGDPTPSIERHLLADVMATWRYPLHMIDFETITPAIPFHRDKRPYAMLAFQFSHHVVQADGSVAHRTEYLQTEPGQLPNFDFVRHLKQALEDDDGTIFRYWYHENTVLCDILAQLEASDAPPSDRDALVAWIRTVTQSPGKAEAPWCGERNMFDFGWVMRRLHYDPLTGGSNSLKYVLPAVLERSKALQKKYSAPIYGTDGPGGIPSHNFQQWRWIRYDDAGHVINPYKLLPPIFDDIAQPELDRLFPDEEIREGGAAMTAYARMQFTQMHPQERAHIAQALKKYCELDTFAMVLLYEYWREVIAG